MKKNHEHFSILSLCDSYFECSNQEVILYTQQSSAWLYGSIFSCLKRRTCLYLVYYVTLYELWSYKKWVVYAMCHTWYSPDNTGPLFVLRIHWAYMMCLCVHKMCPLCIHWAYDVPLCGHEICPLPSLSCCMPKVCRLLLVAYSSLQ